MKAYKIAETTREEREKGIGESIALSTVGGPEPTPQAMVYYQKYIDGEMEMEEVEEAILNIYVGTE